MSDDDMAPATQDTRPEPIEKEKMRMAAARERWAARTPPIQIAFPSDGDRRVEAPHNDDSGHLMRLGDTFGTRSPDFLAIQITELSASVRTRGQREANTQQLNAGLAFIAAVAPENELEAALAVQMAANHAVTTDLLGRAAGAENLEHMQAFGNMAVKMQRTFTAQVEALARLRGKGQQTVRVEHVTVAAGAQAIIGDVHKYGEGAGAPTQTEAQPHETRGRRKAQRRAALPCPDPTRDGVPIPSNAERPVPAARRKVTRRTTGKPKCVQARVVEP